MRAGELRHTLRFEQPGGGRVPGGTTVPGTWTPVPAATEVAAAIHALTGSEALRGLQLQAKATHRLVIRWRAGLSPKMRAVCVEDGRVFQLRHIGDPNGRRIQLELLAEETPPA